MTTRSQSLPKTIRCCRGPHRSPVKFVVGTSSSPLTTDDHDASRSLLEVWTASKLERVLTRRLALEVPKKSSNENESESENENNEIIMEDVVQFSLRYDAHWLQCQPLRTGPLMTILGIYEDEGDPHVPVRVIHYHHVPSSVVDPCCSCQSIHFDWKRAQHRPEFTAKQKNDDELSSPSLLLQWVHFADDNSTRDLLTSKGQAWHFFTSLLGAEHDPWNNPWFAVSKKDERSEDDNNNNNNNAPDLIILELPQPCAFLRDFRVSDACPSWFFHGYAYLENMTSDDDSGILYVFKKLKPRPRMSHRHPLNQTMAPTGCLWESAPRQEDEKGDDGREGKQSKKSTTVYRLLSPPYLNLEQEYGSKIAQGLFSKEALDTFRREALAIPQWTPWPETQHYSVGPDGKPTWSVFPLCYCFPAHDVTQRKWVELTRQFCPKTCEWLETLLGETLRTALFSRMNPETTLEAHTGWADLANAVLRLHIPLVVPELCGTWVDGCVESHQEGRPLLFDDSKIHRAFNYSSRPRIVLIVDLARPSSLPQGYATGGHSEELDQFIAQMSVPK